MALEALLLEVFPDESKEPRSQPMTSQQMAGLAEGDLVRHGLPPEVDPDEAAQDPGIVERFLDRRVREIEPVRQKVNPPQALDADRRAAAALAPGVERLDDGRKLRPRNEAVHLVEESFPADGLTVFLEPSSARVSWRLAALHVKDHKDQKRPSSRDSTSRGNYRHIGK